MKFNCCKSVYTLYMAAFPFKSRFKQISYTQIEHTVGRDSTLAQSKFDCARDLSLRIIISQYKASTL